MPNIFSSNYLSRKPIESATRKFAEKFDKNKKVLDIGCGHKPYSKYFKCQYIGLDPFKETGADIIADAWNIPVPDNEFDGVILNQSLEHIEKTSETIAEIKRVLKPGGLCLVTAPQTMKTHSVPMPSENAGLDNFDKSKIKYWHVDFYRFTKFGLIYLFKDFKIIEIKETNGYFLTIFQLINYFFSSFGLRIIFTPIFFLNNILGTIIEALFIMIGASNIKIARKFNDLIYNSLTLNYILIVKNNDKK